MQETRNIQFYMIRVYIYIYIYVALMIYNLNSRYAATGDLT